MTSIQYKYCFLNWMHITLGNPSKNKFCKICCITQKEINEFLFTDYPFPVPWLHILYTYATTPKNLAFISFFISKIYGVTPQKDVVKVPKSYDRQFITGATAELPRTKQVKSTTKKRSVKIKLAPPKQNIEFPTQDEISQILENALLGAIGETSCSIAVLQDFFDKSLPNVRVKITPQKITFHDTTGKERDRFNVPTHIPLE